MRSLGAFGTGRIDRAVSNVYSARMAPSSPAWCKDITVFYDALISSFKKFVFTGRLTNSAVSNTTSYSRKWHENIETCIPVTTQGLRNKQSYNSHC